MPDDGGVDFAERYGPWALVVGASEGIGADLGHAVAQRGVNVVLVARRQHALDEVADGIRAESNVEVRTIAVDLTEDHAAATITGACSDIEVGFLFYAAGGDPNYEPFLAQPIENAVGLVERNCVVPLRLCHHFADPMRGRGRGAVVIVSSGAAFVGGPNMVAYGATKAFDMVMAEALWSELHESGVDVLGLVIGLTDTPPLRRMLHHRGQLPDLDTPVPGAASSRDVIASALAHLTEGPTYYATADVRMGAEHLGAMTRNDAVRLFATFAESSMGSDEGRRV